MTEGTAAILARQKQAGIDIPVFLDRLAKAGGTPSYRRPRCVGPIAVKSMAPLEKDIAAMKAGMAAAG